jgi:DNA polymerase III sliding clamp (beta) subunit (PCNA family)
MRGAKKLLNVRTERDKLTIETSVTPHCPLWPCTRPLSSEHSGLFHRNPQVLAPELEQAVRRLEKIANEASGIVRLKWTEKEMTLSAQSAEVGEVEATIPANAEDGPGRIAVNVHYLVEYLRGKENLVTMGITSDSSPVLFKYGTSPIVVVMPMMVQW